MTITAVLLGASPLVLYLLGGLALGSINAVTIYLIRNQTPYDW